MFPRTANHFLATPEAIETEVKNLGYEPLTVLNLQLAIHLESRVEQFDSDLMSAEFDAWINTLTTGETIAAVQWIAERLAFKHQQIRLSAETA
jgi:hypothetical protein